MAQANDSLLVTPGSGASIATHLVGGLEHQVVMLAGPSGVIRRSDELYTVHMASVVNPTSNVVPAVWDLWNADSSLVVRVLSIRALPNLGTITGTILNFSLIRAASIGSGGTAQTAYLADTGGTALDADITCRRLPTGGGGLAGSNGFILNRYMNNDETSPEALRMIARGGMEFVPPSPRPLDARGIVIPAGGNGITCFLANASPSTVGSLHWTITFSVEAA